MNNKNQNSDTANAAWDVFRYVAGEMSASEEHDFETRMETDQHSREQVSEMVASMSIMKESLAPQEVRPSSPSLPRLKGSGSRKGIVRLVASVAALIAIVAISIVQITKSKQADSVSDSVAMAWAETLTADSADEGLVMNDLEGLDDELVTSATAVEFEDDFLDDDGSDWVFDAMVAAEEISNERTAL
jgi:anti-sigma-K factor RskA